METLLSALLSTVAASAGASALYEAVRSLYRSRIERQVVENLEAAVGALEIRVGEQQSLVQFVDALLEAASERQRLALLRSERRASNLFRIGTVLMTLSVFVPFLLVAIYYQLDPASEFLRLQKLGVLPSPAADFARRDWHLLVAGVSFGLLFLAAARGILNAEASQREMYFREMRVANYYGDLGRALKIAARVDREPGRLSKHSIADEAMRRVIVQLLDKGAGVVGDDIPVRASVSDSDPDHASVITTLTDSLKPK